MNLYKAHRIGELGKVISEYSTDKTMVNARILDALCKTDLDSLSFDISSSVALFSWEWTDQGGTKFVAIANCEVLSEEVFEILDKY